MLIRRLPLMLVVVGFSVPAYAVPLSEPPSEPNPWALPVEGTKDSQELSKENQLLAAKRVNMATIDQWITDVLRPDSESDHALAMTPLGDHGLIAVVRTTPIVVIATHLPLVFPTLEHTYTTLNRP